MHYYFGVALLFVPYCLSGCLLHTILLPTNIRLEKRYVSAWKFIHWVVATWWNVKVRPLLLEAVLWQDWTSFESLKLFHFSFLKCRPFIKKVRHLHHIGWGFVGWRWSSSQFALRTSTHHCNLKLSVSKSKQGQLGSSGLAPASVLAVRVLTGFKCWHSQVCLVLSWILKWLYTRGLVYRRIS